MSRQKLVAANWKMNKTLSEAQALWAELAGFAASWQGQNVEVVVCPPSVVLAGLSAVEGMALGAQNLHNEPSGAYTGEVSAAMLRSVGVSHVLVGHSERRQYFGEDAEFLAAKVQAALSEGLTPIFCCGEPLGVREAGGAEAWVKQQLQDSLFGLSAEDMAKVVIAYEPIWAIGTGKTASAEQAQAMHAFIRATVQAAYGEELAQGLRILYGGSCNAANAAELFGQSDIDGGLIGGASLRAESFMGIIQAALA